MQKMKNGLMMVCLTVLLSCAALMMNTPTASAMTLADLQGDYRVQDSQMVTIFAGCVITLQFEKGELVGRVKKATRKSELQEGQIFLEDVYVENGKVHCNCLVDGYTDSYRATTIDVINGGKILDFSNGIGGHLLHRM